MLSPASNRAKLFAKTFLRTLSWWLWYLFTCFPFILKLYDISITPKMVKKVIMNLGSSEGSGPDCIPVVILKNCEPELSYILAELFNICLKESCFPDRWKISWVILYLRMLGKGLLLKNTTLLVFFLWLVKSMKNLRMIGLLII